MARPRATITVPSLFGAHPDVSLYHQRRECYAPFVCIPAAPPGDPTACTPFAEELRRELAKAEAIRANPWHGLRFDSLSTIAAKQDRSGVFKERWLSDDSPDYARQYHNNTRRNTP
jgi:hypothetical protein